MILSIYIPYVITPNGDSINDVFYLNGDMSMLDLIIYNRWGIKLFRKYRSNRLV
jgi:hypothetical protein